MPLRPATFILVASVAGSFGLAGTVSRPCALVPGGAIFQAALVRAAPLSAEPEAERAEAVPTALRQ